MIEYNEYDTAMCCPVCDMINCICCDDCGARPSECTCEDEDEDEDDSPPEHAITKDLAPLRLFDKGNGQHECPRCGVGVVIRKTGKHGLFYGCSSFPTCRYTYSPPGVLKPWSKKNNDKPSSNSYAQTPAHIYEKKDKTNMALPTNKDKTAQVIDALKGEGKDAAWQVAANQMVKAAGKTLQAVMKRRKLSKTKVASVAQLLETDIGQALFAFGLGTAISASPLSDGPKFKRLARELRVKAMRDGGDMVADFASDPALELIQSIVSELPDGE